LDKLFIPLIWFIFKGTNITLQEVHCLEYARFSLIEKNDLMPCWLFGKFEIGLAICLGSLLDVNVHPIKQYDMNVHWFQPKIKHNNKRSITICMNSSMKLPSILVPPLVYGMNFFLETIVLGIRNEYLVMTIGNFLGCICLDFLYMSVGALGRKENGKKYKHLYYIFCHVMHCNLLIYEFIH